MTKPINELGERELQERMCDLLTKQEKHQQFFSTVLSIYLILTFLGVAFAVIIYLNPPPQ